MWFSKISPDGQSQLLLWLSGSGLTYFNQSLDASASADVTNTCLGDKETNDGCGCYWACHLREEK